MQSRHIGATARESWPRFQPLTAHDRAVMGTLRAEVEPNKEDWAGRPLPHRSMRSGIAPSRPKVRPCDKVRDWLCEPTSALPDAATLHLHGRLVQLGLSRGMPKTRKPSTSLGLHFGLLRARIIYSSRASSSRFVTRNNYTK